MADTDGEAVIAKITQEIDNISAAITGALVRPKENPVKAISHVIRQSLQLRMWQGFIEAYRFLIDQGKISEEYILSKDGQMTFQELLQTLNSEYVDEKKFKAQQDIFLRAASMDEVERNVNEVIEIMKMINRLTSAQLLILRTLYELRKKADRNNGKFIEYIGAQGWLKLIAEESGLKYMALVEHEEQGLMNLKIISGRHYTDQSGVTQDKNYRLSDFGLEIANYMDIDQDMEK